MGSTKANGEQYEYRGYCYEVIEPGKNEITGKAFKMMQEFITDVLGIIPGMKCIGVKKKKMEKSILTEQENQIMALFASGKGKDEISKILGLKENTITIYLNKIYSKYGLSGKTQIAKAVLKYLKQTGRLLDE